MHSFKDRAGRTWDIEGTYLSYSRVKSHTGVNLFDVASEERKCLAQIADPFTLGQVIWSLVEPQAESRGVSPEQFYAEFDGTVLEAASKALIDEMVFFCQPRARKILGAVVEKARKAEEVAAAVIDQRMPEIEAAIDEEINRLISGSSATSSPASSASTPDRGLFEACFSQSKADSESSGTTPQPS
jgi:hypothetical protein